MESSNLSRRTFVKLAGVVAITGLTSSWLYGCSNEQPTATSDMPTFSSQSEERDLWGSPGPCTVRVGLIMGPPSMGLSQFMLAAQAGRTTNSFEFTVNGVDYTGLAAAFNQGDFDICTLPSNIGPILFNNDELQNEYQVISVNNLGVLYVMTNDSSVTSLDNLSGKTVYSYGQGGTPEYTIQALFKKLSIDESINVEFKSSPLEVLNLMQEQEGCIAILPQPFVSLAIILVDPLYIPVDLTVEWNNAFSDSGSQAVTTTTIVNKQFLEEHEQAVVEYLNMAGQSVCWTLDNMSDAAALQEQLGTFLNDEVALDAMPYISMVNLTGSDMRTALSGFLNELYVANPDSIGGAQPGEEFYYLPPTGSLDEAYLQAGLEEATQHETSVGTEGSSTATTEDAQAAINSFASQE